jgi:hypothetical protein
VKLIDVARAAVPDERVLAAGVFRSGGTTAAPSGLPVGTHVLLVLTPTRVHLFDARSRRFGWAAGGPLAAWDRSDARATETSTAVTIRLELEVVSEGRSVAFEASKSNSAAVQVARILASSVSARAPLGLAPVVSGGRPSPGPAAIDPTDAERLRVLHQRAGGLALAGGLCRLVAYALPWVVLSRADGFGNGVGISGFKVLGSPVLSLAYSTAILVAGALYLRGRRNDNPQLLLGLGAVSLVVFALQLNAVLGGMDRARPLLVARGLSETLGYGVWVELAGALMAFAGGFLANRLSKRPGGPLPARVTPPRPDHVSG